MTKRNAIRITRDAHSVESVSFTVDRYGEIKEETFNEIVAWLNKHKDEYIFEHGLEYIEGRAPHRIIKTQRKGSAIYKILDNQFDAENTLENIRNKDFPKNKQGN